MTGRFGRIFAIINAFAVLVLLGSAATMADTAGSSVPPVATPAGSTAESDPANTKPGEGADAAPPLATPPPLTPPPVPTDYDPSNVPPTAPPVANDDTDDSEAEAKKQATLAILEILRRLPWSASVTIQTDYVSATLPGPGPGTTVVRTRVVAFSKSVAYAVRPSPRPAGTPPGITGPVVPEVRDREVLVVLSAGSGAQTVYDIAQDIGLEGQTLYQSTLLGRRIVRFRIPDNRSIAEVLASLAADSRVERSQPNYVFTTSQGAARPLPVPQYAPAKLRLDQAHKIASGAKIKIAVIDTAIDGTHPALAGAVGDSFDALGETSGAAELHGTAIAGIVSARAELESVAPGATVLAARAFSSKSAGPAQSHTLAVIKALEWAVASGARVANMSFAGPNDPLLGEAIVAAEAQGLVVIAAAGNGGPNAKPAFPAAFSNVIAVSATDDADRTYGDANRGSYIAVAAPGVDIVAAAPKGAYDVSSGTSMAAAHVAGLAALLLERNPKLSAIDVRRILQASARKPKQLNRNEIGAGIVDAEAALRLVK